MTLKFITHLRRLAMERPYRAAQKYMLPQPAVAPAGERSAYLVTATIVRDEARFLREFVAFHQLVGVDHMLVYCDGGDDVAARHAIADFLAEGFVEIIPWPRFLAGRNAQFAAYQHAVAYMLGRCRWLAMIDADEFLFAPESGDLVAELMRLEQHSAIAVYSRTFGTGGVPALAASDLVVERLVMRGPDDHLKNRTQRTIVQPEAVKAIRSANSVLLHGADVLGWDEDGKPVHETGEAGHGARRLRINHYFTRSEQDFRNKLARSYFGKSGHAAKMAGKRDEAADGGLSVVKDSSLQAYVPQLKARIGSLQKVSRRDPADTLA